MPSSPTIATIRDAIKTVIQGVVAAGTPVHTYRRWAKDMEKFVSFFVNPNTKQVHGWMITRISTPETEDAARWRFWSLHRFRLFGYMAIDDDDGTEKTFQDIVELIRDALRLNVSVFGVPERPEQAERTASLISFEPRMLGSVLCFEAIIELTVESLEFKTI